MWVLVSLVGLVVCYANPGYGKGVEIEIGDRLIKSINENIGKFQKLTNSGFLDVKEIQEH